MIATCIIAVVFSPIIAELLAYFNHDCRGFLRSDKIISFYSFHIEPRTFRLIAFVFIFLILYPLLRWVVGAGFSLHSDWEYIVSYLCFISVIEPLIIYINKDEKAKTTPKGTFPDWFTIKIRIVLMFLVVVMAACVGSLLCSSCSKKSFKRDQDMYSEFVKKIPIVFAFDENYRLPASVAISSLIENKDLYTDYEIFVLYNEDTLSLETRNIFDKLHPIKWIHLDKHMFDNYPCSSRYPQIVYYRLAIPELIPERNKVIFSDVDVLFRGDLSRVYDTDMSDYYWGGVVAEKNSSSAVCHKYFSENKNKYIFWAGFMLINSQKMRQEKIVEKLFEIGRSRNDFRHYDLDILNMGCNKIKPLPLDYCYFQELFDADDVRFAPNYSWLSSIYSDEALTIPKKTAKIIHFPNSKIWKLERKYIPEYYWNFLKKSPFFHDRICNENCIVNYITNSIKRFLLILRYCIVSLLSC